MNNLIAAAHRIQALEAELADSQIANSTLTLKIRAADVMAKVADDWVERGKIDSRSALADARLDYGEPFKYSDNALLKRIAKLEGKLAKKQERSRNIAANWERDHQEQEDEIQAVLQRICDIDIELMAEQRQVRCLRQTLQQVTQERDALREHES